MKEKLVDVICKSMNNNPDDWVESEMKADYSTEFKLFNERLKIYCLCEIDSMGLNDPLYYVHILYNGNEILIQDWELSNRIIDAYHNYKEEIDKKKENILIKKIIDLFEDENET